MSDYMKVLLWTAAYIAAGVTTITVIDRRSSSGFFNDDSDKIMSGMIVLAWPIGILILLIWCIGQVCEWVANGVEAAIQRRSSR